jgi:hypothetical protein
VLVWTLGAVAMHAVVPFELPVLGGRARGACRQARRAGQRDRDGGGGRGLMAWPLAAHGRAAPQGWPLESGLTHLTLVPPGT